MPSSEVPVTIDKARHDDHVRSIDHPSVRRAEVGPDSRNLRALDQDISLVKTFGSGGWEDDTILGVGCSAILSSWAGQRIEIGD